MFATNRKKINFTVDGEVNFYVYLIAGKTRSNLYTY